MATDVQLAEALQKRLTDERDRTIGLATAKVDLEKHPERVGRIRALKDAMQYLKEEFDLLNDQPN